MTTETFRLLWTRQDLGIAQIGPVCLIVWQGAVTAQLFERQRWALEFVVAQYPGRAGFVCVIGPSSPPPDANLRQASLDMVTRLGDRLAWVVCVIEGDGLYPNMTRSVLGAMSLLLKTSKPTVTFMPDVSSASSLVAAHFDATSAADLCEAHARLLAAMSTSSS